MCVAWCTHMCDDNLIHCIRASVCWRESRIYLFYLNFSKGARICVTWLKHVCDMTHLYMWHDNLIRCRHLCVCVDEVLGVIRCKYNTKKEHSHVWYDTYFNSIIDMMHLYVWHDNLIRCRCVCVCWRGFRSHSFNTRLSKRELIWVTWLALVCDMTHLYVSHDNLKPLRCVCVCVDEVLGVIRSQYNIQKEHSLQCRDSYLFVTDAFVYVAWQYETLQVCVCENGSDR